MKAKKSLGQHFLRSETALRDIVAAGDICSGDTALEIGPGQGVLTRGLLAAGAHVIAVEKDRELIPVLTETFAQEIAEKKLKLIEADILKVDPTQLGEGTYKLIANIPYYITGAIIEQFLSASHHPSQMVLLIQKEVAERIVARDGKESVLSIAVKAYGTPRIIAKVPAGAFNPPPKVDSAILSINDISRDFFTDIDERLFFKLVKGIFGKKRKQIGGSLADIIGDKAQTIALLQKIAIDPTARPETLHLSQWKALTQIVQRTSTSSV